jgi:hypothetical protein
MIGRISVWVFVVFLALILCYGVYDSSLPEHNYTCTIQGKDTYYSSGRYTSGWNYRLYLASDDHYNRKGLFDANNTSVRLFYLETDPNTYFRAFHGQIVDFSLREVDLDRTY